MPTTLPGGTVHSSDFRAAVPRPSDQVAVAPRPVESIDMEAELHDLRRKLASFEMLAVEMSGSGVLPPAPGTTLKYSPEEAKLAKKLKSLDKHSDHTKSRLKSHKRLKYVSNKEGTDRSSSSSCNLSLCCIIPYIVGDWEHTAKAILTRSPVCVAWSPQYNWCQKWDRARVALSKRIRPGLF